MLGLSSDADSITWGLEEQRGRREKIGAGTRLRMDTVLMAVLSLRGCAGGSQLSAGRLGSPTGDGDQEVRRLTALPTAAFLVLR